MALLAVVAVAAVAVAVALAVGGGGGKGGKGGKKSGAAVEVVRQPADAAGPHPFTASVAGAPLPAGAPAPTVSTSPAAGTLGAPAVSSATRGLYAGRFGRSSCDVTRLVADLTADSARAKAFADVVGIQPAGIGGYVNGLTPVLLRLDTRLISYRYQGGAAAPFAAVLQAGTPVLAGPHGVPRLRCVCGNPLEQPSGSSGSDKYTGASWPGFDASKVVAVVPPKDRLTEFVLYDPVGGRWFTRPRGTTGAQDRALSPSAASTPSYTPSATRSAAGTSTPPQVTTPPPTTTSPVTTPTSAPAS
jgi:hypothetical protein